jgi:hypothetical protein
MSMGFIIYTIVIFLLGICAGVVLAIVFDLWGS